MGDTLGSVTVTSCSGHVTGLEQWGMWGCFCGNPKEVMRVECSYQCERLGEG